MKIVLKILSATLTAAGVVGIFVFLVSSQNNSMFDILDMPSYVSISESSLAVWLFAATAALGLVSNFISGMLPVPDPKEGIFVSIPEEHQPEEPPDPSEDSTVGTADTLTEIIPPSTEEMQSTLILSDADTEIIPANEQGTEIKQTEHIQPTTPPSSPIGVNLTELLIKKDGVSPVDRGDT